MANFLETKEIHSSHLLSLSCSFPCLQTNICYQKERFVMLNRRSISTLLVSKPISLHERMVILLKPKKFIHLIYFYYLVHFTAPKPIYLIRKRGLICKTGSLLLRYWFPNRNLFMKEWFILMKPKKLILPLTFNIQFTSMFPNRYPI